MSDQTTPQDNLVTVTINGQEVKAEKGRLLIDVAEEIGTFVPRFCYHPGMKSVAVCRMCLVQVEGMPKLQPACATPVADGMVVNSVSEEAKDAQEGVLEFLLINHPLDCPICDRAGECPLQDQTYAHGPGSSRYVDEKRHYEKALEISDLVVLDRERCVLCWRCVRFSDEIAGDRFIQLVDRGDGTQILNFADDPFDSYFSGNTIQICPVGALTSKPYRFVSRPWDLETAPSVCDHCSVGCPLTNESRSGSLVRRQALPNEQVNDFWICDKGRFAYHYVSSDERLETPFVRDGEDFKAVGWGEAAALIAEKLKGKTNIGVIAGGHLTTEDAYGISRLAKDVIGTADVDSRIQDAGVPYELALNHGPVAGSTATIENLKAAKTVVWVGPDPKETLPVLYLHLHTGVRDRHQKLLVVSHRSTSLDIHANRTWRCAPGKEAAAIADVRPEIEGDVVFCWTPSSPGRDESASLDATLALASEFGGKVLLCPPHTGSQGMIDMGVHPLLDSGYKVAEKPGRDTRAILEAAANKELDGLLIFGADLLHDFPDAELAKKALSSGVFTVVVELFPTETAVHADVMLPSAAAPEREGTFTNLERRIQKLEPLMKPPGSAREPWKACATIARALGTDWGWHNFNDVWADIKANVPTHKDVDVERLKQEAPAPQPFDEGGFEGEHPDALRMAGPGGQYPKGHRSGAPFHTGQNWPLSWELRAFEAKQRPGHVPHLTGSA
ncbi:MAG: NADH-quinone oxidoreductase subunit NuoG, partial [Actinomycetota bacterium]